MKKIIYTLSFLALFSCNNSKKANNDSMEPNSTEKTESKKNNIQYSDKQLEAYLDSLGHLATQQLAEKVAFGADSVFKHQLQLNNTISSKDLKTIKNAIKKGYINVNLAKKIFKDNEIDTSCRTKSVMLTYEKGLTPVLYFPIGKNKNGIDEFAICIGDPEHCEQACLYFFEGNTIISKHNASNRYGLQLKSYKDSDGKTVVYYVKGFMTGSGIWWNNFFFYKYDDGKLIPILNELRNGNMQDFWGFRVSWLESFVQKTRPLTIKMVYYVQFADTSEVAYSPKIIDDSTIVQYNWNEKSKMLDGKYALSKISKPQLLSYYVSNNDLLFINVYYQTLKNSLNDKTKRKWVLNFLNKVKNYEEQSIQN